MSDHMKKIVPIFIILIIILLIPYILGKFIQYKVEEEIASLNQDLAPITKQEATLKLAYQSGWFSSTATITINNIAFNNQINHTPYTLFKLAKIKTTTQFPEPFTDNLATLFDHKPPYQLTTTVGFTGNTAFNILSPAFGQKSMSIDNIAMLLDWQGLTFDAQLEKDSLDYRLTIPKFGYETNAIKLLIENLNNSMLTQKSIAQINTELPELNLQLTAKGNSTDHLDLFALSLEQIKLKNNAITFSSHKLQTNFIKFTDHQYLSTLSAQPLSIAKHNKTWQASFNYTNRQQVSTQQERLNYIGTHNLSAIELVFPHYDHFLDSLSVDYKMEGLPQKQLFDLLKSYIKWLTLSARNNQEDDKVIAQHSEVEQMAIHFAIATLRQTPKFNISIQLNGSKGNATLNFQASLETSDETSISIKKMIKNLTERLNISFSIKVTKTLLNSVVQSASMGEIEQNRLKQLLQKLPMIESEDQYQTNIIFKNNMFYVNGSADPHFSKTYLPILKEYLP